MQLIKFSIVAASLGGTTYAIFSWRDMDPRLRAYWIIFLAMALVASIPGFVEGLNYILSGITGRSLSFAWTSLVAFLIGAIIFLLGFLVLIVCVFERVEQYRGERKYPTPPILIVMFLVVGIFLFWFGLVVMGFDLVLAVK